MADAQIIPIKGRDDDDVPIVEPVAGPDSSEPGESADVLATLLGAVASIARDVLGPDNARRAIDAVAVLSDRLLGEYEVDEFGFDEELTDQFLAPVLRQLYRRWFRVEVSGVENVPSSGGALLVGNHSGVFPADALITQLAVLDEHPLHRHVRLLGGDLLFSLPIAGELARKSGSTLACSEDAARLLGRGELVEVFPEGYKGTGKPFTERYKLQRFGRGGFVASALAAQVPIIPVAIVGAEETYPMLANAGTLARLLNLPYFPITPTFPWLGLLGLVPLPSKWLIEFGDPIETHTYGAAASEDPALVFNLTDQVRETIQQSLYRLLTQRKSTFF